MPEIRKICKALEYLVDRGGPVEDRTRLMKLIYLADLAWATGHGGRPYTEASYYRWNHGPFSQEVLRALEWMDGIEIVEETIPWERGETYCYRSGERTRLGDVELDQEFKGILDGVVDQWRHRPLRELLEHVYGGEQFKDKVFGQPLLE
jgi:hypothetical protein